MAYNQQSTVKADGAKSDDSHLLFYVALDDTRISTLEDLVLEFMEYDLAGRLQREMKRLPDRIERSKNE